MTTIATLVVKLTADAGDFHAEMDRAASRTKRLLGGLQSLGRTAIIGGMAAASSAVAGFGAVAAATLPLASEFQDSLTELEIAARGSGLSLQELHDAALAVGADTQLVGVSASGAAEAMVGLYKAGLSTTEIFGDLQGYLAGTAELGGALRASIDLAAATELDMVEASELAATALSTFGGGLESAEERAAFVTRALDNMVRAADASVADVSDLAEALKNVGPVAAAMGMSIEETNNALAILSTRGIRGAEAGTMLKSMLANMRRPTKDVTAAWQALGISLYDAEGRFRGLPTVLADLEQALSSLTQQEREQYIQRIAGTYGMVAMTTLLEEGAEGWEAMAQATAQAAGIQDQAAAKSATLSGRMEALEGTIESIRIRIGEALIPAATRLVDALSGIAEKAGPALERFLAGLEPLMERAAEAAAQFIEALLAGEDPILAIQEALQAMGLGEIADWIGDLAARVEELIAIARPYAEQIIAWVSSHVELRDVLMGLALAIGSVIVPAVASLLAPILSLAATAGILIGVIAAVRSAWESDWGGIRSALEGFWAMAQPALASLAGWLQEKIPQAAAALSSFWQGTLQPALQAGAAWIQANLLPILSSLASWLQEKLPPAIQAAANFWQNTLYPAIVVVANFLTGTLIPYILSVANLLEAELSAAIRIAAALWENRLYPAIQKIWGFIQEHLIPILQSLAGLLEGPLSAAAGIAQAALDAFLGLAKSLANELQRLTDWINRMAEKIRSMPIPDWAIPGSPPPLAQGLMMIGEAMRDLSGVEVPALRRQMGLLATPAPQISVGGDTYHVSVSDEATAALLMAMAEERQRERLSRFMGG